MRSTCGSASRRHLGPLYWPAPRERLKFADIQARFLLEHDAGDWPDGVGKSDDPVKLARRMGQSVATIGLLVTSPGWVLLVEVDFINLS